jgi:surface polysaccharide O-acyltransferase-like enzyme
MRNSFGDGLKHKYVCLDLVRGLAALVVVAGHLTNFLFAGFNGQINVFWRGFSLLIRQGHSAVMVFFVMSGYLVSKHVYQEFKAIHMVTISKPMGENVLQAFGIPFKEEINAKAYKTAMQRRQTYTARAATLSCSFAF